ncbi:MAG TPA: sulfatase [Deltaproteobacteria bacterium]|nr:sulfatase [Deltaproteobacteria bacterium]HCP46581.1 sulfatase [Deltaproteobacteria bacterium]
MGRNAHWSCRLSFLLHSSDLNYQREEHRLEKEPVKAPHTESEPKPRRTTWRSRLPNQPPTGIWLFTLLAPLFLLCISLKVFRIAAHPTDFGTSDSLFFVLPDLLFQAGLLSLGLGLMGTARVGWARHLVLLALQLVALAVATIEMLATAYLHATGFTLDYSITAFALSRLDETWTVAASEVQTVHVWFFAVSLIVLAVGPWLAVWKTTRHPTEPSGPAGKLLWAALLVALSTALFAISLLPTSKETGRAFVRPAPLHLALGMLEKHEVLPQPGEQTASSKASVAARPSGPDRIYRDDPESPLPNVVLIILESTRADSLTPYNPGLDTTPFLAKIAEKSTLVDRAYAVVPHTSKSLVSILCGIEPRLSLAVPEARKGGMPGKCLAKLLGEMGYTTAYFQTPKKSFERRSRLVDNMGYEHFLSGDMVDVTGFSKVNYFGYEDAVMLEPSRAWLEEHAKERLFVTYLTNIQHHPYGLPKSHAEVDYRPFGAKTDGHNRYLNTVNYGDSFIEKIVDQYKELGLYENTVFVITSDHGEGFREHGQGQHDDVVFEEGLRIPWLIYKPSDPQPRRITQPASTLDVAPTVLDILGFRFDADSYPGGSILGDLGDRVLHASCYRRSQCLVGIYGHEKLIYYFDDRPPHLFDLAADPGEKTNLAEQNPAKVAARIEELRSWSRAVHELHRPFAKKSLRAAIQKKKPSPENKQHVFFGDALEMVGFDYPKGKGLKKGGGGKVRAGRKLVINYYLRAMRELSDDYRLVLVGTGENSTKNLDHIPVRGLHPFSDWKTTEYVRDSHRFNVPYSWRDKRINFCLKVVHATEGTLPVTGDISPRDGCVPITSMKVKPRKQH